MPEPRTPGTDLRRAILDKSRHLLVAEGYPSLSMRKIARAVGCSATSIYLHFESKDALTHALIDEGMARLHEALRQRVAEAVDPRARLEALCRAYVAFGQAHPEYYEIMFMLHPAQMARYPAEKYRQARRNLELFAEVIGEGTRAGVFEAEDALEAASVVWAALHGAVALLLARRLDVRIGPEAFVEAVIRHALAGCSPARAEVLS